SGGGAGGPGAAPGSTGAGAGAHARSAITSTASPFTAMTAHRSGAAPSDQPRLISRLASSKVVIMRPAMSKPLDHARRAPDPEVVIVGAGFGGMGAAIQLGRMGIDSIVILD